MSRNRQETERDLQRNPDDLKQFLWDTMVIMPPELRRPVGQVADDYGAGESTVVLEDAHTILVDPGQ